MRWRFVLARSDWPSPARRSTSLSSLGLPLDGAVEAGEAVLADLVPELLLDLELALGSKFQRDDLAGSMPNTMGDVIAGDVQDFAIVGDPADHHVRMGVAGVVVVDRDPVQLGLKVALHLLHQPSGKALEIPKLDAVLRRYDQPELMAIIVAAIEESGAIELVFDRAVKPA
jgi:hypothetical protein